MVDHEGWTALHEACKHGRIECVRLLLSSCKFPCDLLQIKASNEGITPLHDAVANGFVDIVEVIMENFSRGNRAEEALQCSTRDGLTVHQLSPNAAMRELLQKYQNAVSTHNRMSPTKILKVSNPSRLTVVLGQMLYRYVSSSRLHSIQSLMLQMAEQRVGYVNIRNGTIAPFLTISKSEKLSIKKSKANRQVAAEDFSTHLKLVSKAEFQKNFVINS